MKAHAVGPSITSSIAVGLTLLTVAATIAAAGASPAWAEAAPTTTSLTVTAGGVAVTSVAPKTVVTLMATVKAGGAALTKGQVKFCDSSQCTDIHLLGLQQLTSAGRAVMKFTPGPGSHQYKAIFVGNVNDATSASSSKGLSVSTVQVQYPTSTTITQGGTPANYTLSATVTGVGAGKTRFPSGAVSFKDTSNGNAVLGSGVLYPGLENVSWGGSYIDETDGYPYPMVVADFNGDGKLDLAVGNRGNGYDNSGFISIYLGNGDGTFSVLPRIATGASCNAIAVGDFNGDGIPDLAAAAGGTLDVLLGVGDGTFYTPSNQTEAPSAPNVYYPSQIAVGDFNRDGIADLAVTNLYGGVVTVLLGVGDGTFTPATVNPNAGFNPQAIAVGDFNGDSIPDLVVTSPSTSTVTLLIGNAEGGFAPTAISPTMDGAEMVLSADFNHDGKDDLALLTGSTVTVLLGNGDSTFSPPASAPQPQVATPPPMGSVALAVGDFNGDGIPDMIVLNTFDYPYNSENYGNYTYSFSSVVALLGDGTGRFTPNSLKFGDNIVEGIYNSAWLVAADFTGSGIWSFAEDSPYMGAGDVFAEITRVSPTATAAVSGVKLPDSSGTHQVEADYPGDTNYKSSSSASLPLVAPTPVVLYPTSLSFVDIAGYPANSQTVTLTNNRTTPLQIQAIYLNVDSYNGSGTPFAMSNNCPATLAPGASCRFTIQCTITGYYQASAELDVYDSDPSSPQVTYLGGEISDESTPSLVTLPSSLDFGNVPAGFSSTTLSTTLEGTGADLGFASIALTGPGASAYVLSNYCGHFLPVTKSCQLGVRFAPQQAAAAYPATITITSNANNSPQAVTLSGSSLPAAPTTLSFSTTSVTLPYQEFLEYKQVLVTNTGEATAYFNPIDLGGANAANYLTANSCRPTLAPGATCQIGVRLNPAGPGAEPLPATITVTDNAATSPQVITINEAPAP